MTRSTTRRALAHAAAALALPIWLCCATSCKKPPDSQAQDKHDHAHDDHGHSGGAEHAEEVTLTADAIARYGITIAEAKPHALQPTFVAPALVAFNADAMAHVGSPLRGRIAEISVRVGDEVTKVRRCSSSKVRSWARRRRSFS
jgi:multidrug efflux pump subunit AcrA (membrane-fusion protein)